MTGEEHQSLAVMVETPDWIDFWNRDEVLEGAALGLRVLRRLGVGELAENVEGFVENEIAMRHGCDAGEIRVERRLHGF